MAGFWTREMTTSSFIHTHMAIDATHHKSFDEGHALNMNITQKTEETEMCKRIAKCLEGICSNFDLISLDDISDSIVESHPDLVLVDKSQQDREKSETTHLPSILVKTGVPIVVKNELDPFQNPLSENTHFLRGRLVTYVTNILALQHRTHLFAVGIFGSIARFFRFDRAGGFVSGPINYIQDRLMFLEFFRRYDLLTDKDRGYDVTVTPASFTERSLFYAKLLEFSSQVRDGDRRPSPAVEQTLAMWQRYETCKVAIPNHTLSSNSSESYSFPPTSNTYIFSAPFFHPVSITGRATKCFVAYCMELGKLVCLKDTWRSDHPSSKPEHIAIKEICRTSEQARGFVPVVYSAGDVTIDGKSQRTLTDKWESLVGAEWVDGQAVKSMRPYLHYRITEELLYPLSTVKNCSELCVVMYDIHLVLLIVWHCCGNYLHRDVSAGNVMSDENGRGKLADWDHSRQMSKSLDESQPCQSSRTGTWRFLSLKLIQDPHEPHQLVDDLESLFWVFIYTALRYCHIKIPNFDFSGLFDGEKGFGKDIFLKGNALDLFHLGPLQALFVSYSNIFRMIHVTRIIFLLFNEQILRLEPIVAKSKDIPQRGGSKSKRQINLARPQILESDDENGPSARKAPSESELRDKYERRHAQVKDARQDYFDQVDVARALQDNKILDLLRVAAISLTEYSNSDHYKTVPCQFSPTRLPNEYVCPGTIPMRSPHADSLSHSSLSFTAELLQTPSTTSSSHETSTSQQFESSSRRKRTIDDVDSELSDPFNHCFPTDEEEHSRKRQKLDEDTSMEDTTQDCDSTSSSSDHSEYSTTEDESESEEVEDMY